jgi:uncharacterized protein with NAD-binding domain and iron-sulfur cluster
MDNSVLVFGAGVAGLSAAHELAERGFRVTVWEPRATKGGKARSVTVPRSAQDGRMPLPGEHGFRLFPGFYRHLPEVMSRIPYRHNVNGVADNLVSVKRTLFASCGQRPLRFPVHTPRSLADLGTWTQALVDAMEAWVPAADSAFFVHRLLVLLTSCTERRETEFERTSWWQFMDAANRSANYQRYLAGGLTRSLVALRPEEGSARTLGLILQALMFDTLVPGRSSDRVLNGPTNAVWIDPWVDHLRALGVKFRQGKLVRFETSGTRITGARISSRQDDEHHAVATHYVCALPYEIARETFPSEALEAAPSLRGLWRLRSEWMNGIQYYLDRDVPLNDGHCIFVDSPWALTAISQRQFWTGIDMSSFGDGTVQGVISVDISDWNSPGVLYGKPARECTAAEIAKEVWAQMKLHLNGTGDSSLHDQSIIRWFLDPSIVFDQRGPQNTEPLLINTVDSLKHRPAAETEIENLYLAGDYVRTNTDLATMEAANESARRAVNAILSRSGPHYSRCTVWPLAEPPFLAPLKVLDSMRFKRGLPHPWYDGRTTSLRTMFANRLSALGLSFRAPA